MQIDKIYEPQRFEPHWSRWWIDRGIFHASPKAGGRVFSLVIPPPNVTGSLHMGHMLEHTEIDVVIRELPETSAELRFRYRRDLVNHQTRGHPESVPLARFDDEAEKRSKRSALKASSA